MKKWVGLILLLVTVVGIASDAIYFSQPAPAQIADNHDTLAAPVEHCPDATSDSTCADHACHVGHSCHCASLVSAANFSWDSGPKFLVPAYSFSYTDAYPFPFKRPPIYA